MFNRKTIIILTKTKAKAKMYAPTGNSEIFQYKYKDTLLKGKKR